MTLCLKYFLWLHFTLLLGQVVVIAQKSSCPASYFTWHRESQLQYISTLSCQYEKKMLNVSRTSNNITREEYVSPELYAILQEKLYIPTLDAQDLCGEHSNFAKQSALELQLWALKMFDSSAKLPSGILNGNVNQLGDFDQCLSVRHEDITGQYCLVHIDIHPTDNAGPRLRHALRLARSYDLIRSNVTDPGHRVPRYTSFNWATCVPASCTAEHVERGLTRALLPLAATPELEVHIHVEPQLCYVKQPYSFDVATSLTILLFTFILTLTIIATVIDVPKSSTSNESRTKRMILAFSLRHSWNSLMSTSAPANDLSSVHGVRFLNAIGLLICHKSIALFFDPFVNRTIMAERMSHPWTIIGRTAILYTDSFILLSGLLVAYALLPELDRRKGRLDIRSKYVTRFLRITPNLVAIILFCTYVMQFLGSGPLWTTVVQHYADMCKQHMWRNLLYIHNYFGFEEMCLTHTHQLGIDMQLYLVSPLLVYLLWRWPRAGLAALVTIAGLSTWLRFVVTQAHQLSSIVYFGITIRRMFDTANLSYILPTHRITSYIIGILLGYYLKRNPNGLQLTKAQTVLGWTVTGIAAAVPWFSFYRGCSTEFEYDATLAAYYTAFYPLSWCTFITGLILLCHQHRGGYVGIFLRWKGFLVFTRLAYAVYLTQFPIFFYNIGTRRHAGFSSHLDLINLPEFLVVFIASVILTLLIDLPFQQVKKVLTEKQAITTQDNSEQVTEKKQSELTTPSISKHITKRSRLASG